MVPPREWIPHMLHGILYMAMRSTEDLVTIVTLLVFTRQVLHLNVLAMFVYHGRRINVTPTKTVRFFVGNDNVETWNCE